MDSASQHKMQSSLACGSLGITAFQQQAIQWAARFGFTAVAPDLPYLSGLGRPELLELRAELKAKGLQFGAAGSPVDLRHGEEEFQASLARLPEAAAVLEQAGVDRLGTSIKPTHDELTYLANFQQHVRRLGAVAAILDDHGIRFGLEYVGPKTSWSSKRYPFIHTLAETRELIAAVGRTNVGLVLDSWHWYTAGETAADLLSLSNRDVVCCDLNDAPRGIAVEQQMDLSRELPCATGVIDLKTFLAALVKIGFDGPVRAEPFNAALRKLPPEEAVAKTAAAMKQAFALLD